MSASEPKVVHDHWDAYPISTDDGPMFVLFDVEATQQDLTAALPFCARVIVPIKEPNEQGGPIGDERQRLDDMEDDLCTALALDKVDCRMVGRLTFQGIREIVFQLRDYETFRPTVGRWMLEQTDYEIDVSEHDGWDFFRDCICPSRESWAWIADRNVIDHLLESGADPLAPHRLDFVFVGAAPGLRQVAETLQQSDYTPLSELDFTTGTIVLCKSLPLDLHTIFEHSLTHLQLADSCGVEYDGWGTTVESQ
jgi:regulator of RNase E activity RraB